MQVEADSTSVASSESLNSTFVLSKSGGDEKENEAFTPYYKRMPALLSAGEWQYIVVWLLEGVLWWIDGFYVVT